MSLFFLPFFYVVAFIFWSLIVITMITLYIAFVVVIFLLTALAMGIRAVFHSQRPQNPRRPHPPKVIPQSRWSNRR